MRHVDPIRSGHKNKYLLRVTRRILLACVDGFLKQTDRGRDNYSFHTY